MWHVAPARRCYFSFHSPTFFWSMITECILWYGVKSSSGTTLGQQTRKSLATTPFQCLFFPSDVPKKWRPINRSTGIHKYGLHWLFERNASADDPFSCAVYWTKKSVFVTRGTFQVVPNSKMRRVSCFLLLPEHPQRLLKCTRVGGPCRTWTWRDFQAFPGWAWEHCPRLSRFLGDGCWLFLWFPSITH